MRQVVAVLISALLMWMSFPPLDWGFLVFVAPAPFLWALRRVETAREAGWLGFLFGFVFYGSLLSWIFVLGAVAWLPLTIVMSLWATGYGLLMYLARGWSVWRWWAAAVGGWALWELLRDRWPLGGFPWGSLGYPVGTLAWPRGAAQWIGASGWSVLVIAAAAGLVLTFDDEHDRRPLELAAGAIVLLTVLGAFFAPDASGPAVRVALVQGNSPCPRVHCADEKVRIFSSHMALTSIIETSGADLVVWGEDSFGGDSNPTFNAAVRSSMAGQAQRIGAALLAGGTRPSNPGTFDNYNVVFGPDGVIVDEYLKRHPVPFGEFVPFRRIFEFIPQLDQVPNDMNRGSEATAFPLTVDGGSGLFGSVISFEGAFARYMRATVNAGAQLMVVATNEGSFGAGSASDQLLGMVRMSAASLGVDVVHVAVTGKSAIVRADGSIPRTTELFTEDLLQGVVNLQTSRRTVYAAAGDWLQLGVIAAAIWVAVTSVGGVSREFRIRAGRRR
ncbi:MAG: apolipoprotein N-acyltransferase [Acidimicrobiia bacterium]|nr:MAG: apolipoprotein N-acyltransferase [Acidimicrobiia bacterium]